MDISLVSHYKLEIVETGPYVAGATYNLRVTPQNLTNVNTACNQTVELPAVAGVTYGLSSHKFAWGETSWTTTVVFSAAGSISLKSQDQYFYLDIVDTYAFTVVAGGFQLSLVAGWNLVTVPPIGYGYKASTLGLVKNDIVVGWNSATQIYDKNYVVGVSLPFKDFNIEANTGYWIYVSSPETLTLQGTYPTVQQSKVVTVPASGGWVIVGFNTERTDMRAKDLPGNYTGVGKISQVVSYNPVTKLYKTYNPLLPFTDYALAPGQGYWLMVTGSGTLTYMP
jgi:hypothetical protein